MSVGDNIRTARIKKGFNQKELADKLGENGIKVGNTTISNWESGFSKPDPDTIAVLCQILEVDANYILNFYKSSNTFDETEILFDKYKDILTDDDKETIRFLIEKRKREIDKQLGED